MVWYFNFTWISNTRNQAYICGWVHPTDTWIHPVHTYLTQWGPRRNCLVVILQIKAKNPWTELLEYNIHGANIWNILTSLSMSTSLSSSLIFQREIGLVTQLRSCCSRPKMATKQRHAVSTQTTWWPYCQVPITPRMHSCRTARLNKQLGLITASFRLFLPNSHKLHLL